MSNFPAAAAAAAAADPEDLHVVCTVCATEHGSIGYVLKRVVKKEGPNQGKDFYVCEECDARKKADPNAKTYFAWTTDPVMHANSWSEQVAARAKELRYAPRKPNVTIRETPLPAFQPASWLPRPSMGPPPLPKRPTVVSEDKRNELIEKLKRVIETGRSLVAQFDAETAAEATPLAAKRVKIDPGFDADEEAAATMPHMMEH